MIAGLISSYYIPRPTQDKGVCNNSLITVAMDMLHLAMGTTVCCL